MAVLRAGAEYRFSALDPKRGQWPRGWQSRVAATLARAGWGGTLIWLADPVPWWTVLPSLKCGGDAVLVWLDLRVEGEDLDTDLLERALNEAVGCIQLGEVGVKPDLPPDHSGETPSYAEGRPAWLTALVIGAAAYLGLSAVSMLVRIASDVRRVLRRV